MPSKEEARREEEKAVLVGHVVREDTRQRIAGMGTPKVDRLGRQIRVKEKEKMVSKPWAKATARTKVEKQEEKEVVRKGGAQTVLVGSVTTAWSLGTAPNGAPSKGKEEEEDSQKEKRTEKMQKRRRRRRKILTGCLSVFFLSQV